MHESIFHIAYLKKNLELIKSRNSRFSLRSYARRLGINVATLSKVMRNHEIPSKKTSLKILDALNASALERARFLDSILAQQIRSLDLEIRTFGTILHADDSATQENLTDMMADAIEAAAQQNGYGMGYVVRVVLIPTYTEDHQSEQVHAEQNN